jgi:cysteine-rich repeat protein
MAYAWWLVGCSALSWPAQAQPQPQPQPSCEGESQCSFKKPNILLVLDYSSSMSGSETAPAYFPPGQTMMTRWGAELEATRWILHYGGGFFANNARIGLTRFAHDPDLTMPGTTVRTDRSFPAITDGFAIDVPFDGSQGQYLECKGSGVEAAIEVLRSTPPPPTGMRVDANTLMLTWTRGALQSAHALIDRTRKNHAAEPGEDSRDYEVVLMTDGDWTCPTMVGQNCKEDPAPEAALLRRDRIPVHVIAFGDAAMQPSLSEVALQGGTGTSIDATSPQGIVDAFSTVLDGIRNSVIVPTCTRKLARVLITMDASTSMIAGNAPGQTKWDKARFALTGNPAAPLPGDPGYVEPLLRRKLQVGGREVAIEDVVHMGMVAFASAEQQVLMANFGPCMRDNFAWAMDPLTSCEAPGCRDPYAGSPLSWTFKNSDTDRRPRFVRTTHSYMPACNSTPGSKSCAGQVPTTFTGQGLEFARNVIADYKRNPAPFTIDDRTRFVNVLITDGQTSDGSSDVHSALAALLADGVDTYVIGFGSGNELDRPQLEQYASWGNTKAAIVVDPAQASGANALADALAGIVQGLGLDSCCVLNDCAAEPEPADPNAVCGDGRVEGDERCDDGEHNATYGHCGGRCDGLHLFCGDKRVDGPEVCDDGNTRSGDGCDARCMQDDGNDALDAADDAGVTATRPSTVTSVVGPRADSGVASATRGMLPVANRTGAGSDAGVAAGLQSKGCGCTLLGTASEPPAALAWIMLLGLWRLCRRPITRRSMHPSIPKPSM